MLKLETGVMSVGVNVVSEEVFAGQATGFVAGDIPLLRFCVLDVR